MVLAQSFQPNNTVFLTLRQIPYHIYLRTILLFYCDYPQKGSIPLNAINYCEARCTDQIVFLLYRQAGILHRLFDY